MNIDGYSIDVKISILIRHSVTSPSAAMQGRWVKHAPPRLLAIPPTSVAACEALRTFATRNGSACRRRHQIAVLRRNSGTDFKKIKAVKKCLMVFHADHFWEDSAPVSLYGDLMQKL
jgi:hypothetical protein